MLGQALLTDDNVKASGVSVMSCHAGLVLEKKRLSSLVYGESGKKARFGPAAPAALTAAVNHAS